MSRTRITGVDAWEVLDSRGNPTVACEITVADGATGYAAVPSGASTGRHEAHELRDGGQRYAGMGVRRAVANVRGELADAVRGLDAAERRALDTCLRGTDGTPNLCRLGANATLAVSVAAARAVAASEGCPLWRLFTDTPLLPLPMVNMISGGAHAGGLIDIQDILAVPVAAKSVAQAIEQVAAVRRHTARLAADLGLMAALVADEGGLAGPLPSNRAGLELLARGVEASGLALGDDIAFAVDIAANQLLDDNGDYRLAREGRRLDSAEFIAEIRHWTRDFPIVSVEDVLADDDWDGWTRASNELTDIQLLGDDLFATNSDRLRRGTAASVANAILIKPNQVGTLSDALDAVELARDSGYATVISARSGETEDSWLADLAVGWRTGQIKVGSTARSERGAKWNRLMHIEHSHRACYAGAAALAPIRKDNP